MSVQSCGRTISLDSPPHRVVVVGASLSDTLFELGLGGRISALASADSTPDPKHREQLDALPSVGSPYPGKEALIASQPDVVITQQAHYVSGKNGAPSIDRLDKLGIPVYVAAGGCGDVDTDTAGVSGLFDDIRNYGTMFGAPDRAKALITRLEGTLADVRARVAGHPKLRVAELSQVGGQVYATTGGPSQDVLTRAGAENVFAGLPGQYTPLSAEQITARNPQAFVVQDFTASSAGKDIASLKNTFPTTDAVENQRLLSIDASKAGAPGSTRMVTGVVEIAKFLYPDAFTASSPSPSR